MAIFTDKFSTMKLDIDELVEICDAIIYTELKVDKQ